MKLNTKGAVDMMLLAALAVVLIVGGFVILRISDSTEDEAKSADISDVESEEPTAPEDAADSNSSFGIERVSFDTPNGWSRLECPDYASDADVMLLSPDSIPATDCDDREDVILLTVSSSENMPECQDDYEGPDSKGNTNYSCTQTTEDGVVITNAKLVRPDNTWANGFDFYKTDTDFVASFTTYYSADEQNPEYAATLADLIQTIDLD